MNLLASVIQSLHTHKGRWPEIAERAGVSYSWVCKIATNQIPDPRVKGVERIAKTLKEMKLFVQVKDAA